MKRCLTSLMLREIKINTRPKNYLSCSRLSKIEELDRTVLWWGCGEILACIPAENAEWYNFNGGCTDVLIFWPRILTSRDLP